MHNYRVIYKKKYPNNLLPLYTITNTLYITNGTFGQNNPGNEKGTWLH